MSTIVAHQHPYVIGVDTHAATHTFAVLTAEGVSVDTQTFPNSHPGLQRAIAWAARRTNGDLDTLWVIEGIGSYGAALAKLVASTGYLVVEAPRMLNKTRYGIGKSDAVDAQRMAAAVLSMPSDQLRHPRLFEGHSVALKVLLTARDEIARERTRAVNALTALVRSMELGVDARHSLAKPVITEIAAWRARQEPLAIATARTEAIRLAKRIHQADADLKTSYANIAALIATSPAAQLTQEIGIGPVTAAIALVAWSHPGRFRNEAAFAALAGTSPLPASSGKTTRYRLNRGGDRQLNRAFNVMAMVRMVHDPETQRYVEKRRADGKTDREIRRVLKRYLARRIYRHFNHAATLEQRG